jgi:hypothetical protein
LVARSVHLKASSEAEATIAPVLIATVRGRSAADRRTGKHGQLALTNDGYSILQSDQCMPHKTTVFAQGGPKSTVEIYGLA